MKRVTWVHGGMRLPNYVDDSLGAVRGSGVRCRPYLYKALTHM
jgi:hypothetical protein